MHLKQIYHLFQNVLAGSYVNFAICEYYNDSIFTITSKQVLSSIIECNSQELRSYAKVNRRAHTLILQYMQDHIKVLFLKFEPNFIEQILMVLLNAMSDPLFEVQTDSVGALNIFNEFVHEHINMKSTPKHAELIHNVRSFF